MTLGSNIAPAWDNRITDYDPAVPLDQLLAHPMNPKIHPRAQTDALKGILGEVGWLTGVIVNRTSNRVLDGHDRIKAAMEAGQATAPVFYVSVPEAQEPYILATFDPVGSLAATDSTILDDLLGDVQTGDSAVQSLLDGLKNDIADALLAQAADADPYTHKILSPQYEPSEDVPPVADLFDTSRTQALLTRIDAAPAVPDEVRAFLQAAAHRHTVFNFKRIADYYASAPAEVQTLMEESALVILDYDDAVRLGYVRVADKIAQLRREDYGDEDVA